MSSGTLRLYIAASALVVAAGLLPAIALVRAVFSDRENWDESARWSS